MAFELSKVYGYGTGKLDDIEISDGTLDSINTYARITAIDELSDEKVVIDAENIVAGDYEQIAAGNDVLIHISAAATETEYLGKYMVAKILLVSTNGIVTLDKPITDLIPRDQFDYYNVQMITAANFDCLTLKEGGIISPKAFDPYKLVGGILFIRCWDSLKFEGGHINLVDCGLPANRKQFLRPLTTQETAANGEGDVAKYSGQENFITAERFLLNAGDGAAFIVAKNFVGNADSRIGNTATHGASFCRGAENSVGVRPSNITNKGGSTILICAENIINFSPKMIAKYRDSKAFEGAGVCRCYIASTTTLPNDEGLYSYDVLSDSQRLVNKANVYDFGAGTFATVSNPQKPLNNYGQVTAINQGGCRLTLINETNNGLAPIIEGAMILVQVIQKSTLETEHAGEIVKATILERGENYIVTDFPAPNVDLSKYLMQVISVPQFTNFNLSTNFTATPAFNGKIGGVFAIAVSETCDLRDGKINVEGKGGAEPYGENGLKVIGNAQNATRLPLGSGHGSVWILAKTLTLNDNTRIGARYSGGGTGDTFGGGNSSGSNRGGGYAGAVDDDGQGSAGGYNGGGAATQNFVGGFGGSGASGGTSSDIHELQRDKICGGYGSNGADYGKYTGGRQGAHLWIVADKINGFTQNAFSTGGEGGNGKVKAESGAAGYGGGAAKDGSSGGSSGWCFIYTN